MAHTPYMQLSRKGSGLFFLNYNLETIIPYEKFIDNYPYIKCEPLEFLYQTHRSVCAMDKLLFEDLTRHCWRSISWAAWIALVTPYPKRYMLKLLSLDLGERIRNQWSVKSAVLRLKGKRNNPEFDSSLSRFHSYLNQLPYRRIPLRKFDLYSKKSISHFEDLKSELRNIYKTEGSDPAISFLRTRDKLPNEVPYAEWLSKTTTHRNKLEKIFSVFK